MPKIIAYNAYIRFALQAKKVWGSRRTLSTSLLIEIDRMSSDPAKFYNEDYLTEKVAEIEHLDKEMQTALRLANEAATICDAPQLTSHSLREIFN